MTPSIGIDFTVTNFVEKKRLDTAMHSFYLGENLVESRKNTCREKNLVIENVEFNSLSERESRKKIILKNLRDFFEKHKDENLPIKIFVTKNSFEHNILQYDEFFFNKIAFHGNQIKKDTVNKKIDSATKPFKYTQEKNSTKNKSKPKNNNIQGNKKQLPHEELINSFSSIDEISFSQEKYLRNTLFLEFETQNELSLKAYEISIIGYQSHSDYMDQRSPVLENISHGQDKKGGLSAYATQLLMPHINMAIKEKNNVVITFLEKDVSLVASLRRQLKAKNINNVKFIKAVEKRQDKSKENIIDFISKKYEDLNDLSNKTVIYTDGSFIDGRMGSGFLIKSEGKQDIKGHYSQKEDKLYKHSNGAEILAFVKALEKIKDSKLTSKPIYFVFDSNYVFVNLSKFLNGDTIPNPNRPSFQRAIDLIKELGIEDKIHATVIKSHIKYRDAISPEHKALIKANDVVDSLSRQALGLNNDNKIPFYKKITRKISSKF